MHIVAIRTREIAWTLDGRGAAAGRTERRGIVVEVRTNTGIAGYGEASPLPGISRDTLDDTRAALAEFERMLAGTRAALADRGRPADDAPTAFADDAHAIAETHTSLAHDPHAVAETHTSLAERSLELDTVGAIFDVARRFFASPAARFAIETALLDAFAQTRHTTIARVLDPTARAAIATSVVVDSADDARAAVAAGAHVLKVKVGVAPSGHRRLTDDELAAIMASASGRALRLDANRSWPRDSVRERLAGIARLASRAGTSVEFVEEPCIDTHTLLSEPLALPIALDESLVGMSSETLDRALASRSLAALVLKPTLLGGFAECLSLAARARAAGVATIVTHALEGPIGSAACFELARVVGGSNAHGVSSNASSSTVAATIGEIKTDSTVTDSATAAARTAAARTAAASATATDSAPAADSATATDSAAAAAGTARRGSRRAIVRVATPTLATVESIRAALETRQPIAVLHPALPEAELARQRAAVEAANLHDDDALVLFTSGSTGPARGVVLSRAAIVAAADASAQHLGWRADDRWLLALSTAHAGGAAVVARCHFAARPIAWLERWDRAAATKALEECTLASLVPTQLADLLADPTWRPSRRLRAVLLGGAAASPALLAAAAARGVPFLATYGMTESFGQLATAPLDRAGDPEAPLLPLRGVELRAGTRTAPAPIRVRGPMLASRYLDGAPIAPEHATSDLGFVDGGLHVVGRVDDMIITGGENVSPATVEAVLAATPGVRAACAFAIPDQRWGQVVGAAIAAERLDGDAISAWRAGLPAHARPREVAVVAELPMLASGKLDRLAAARLPRAVVRY